MNMIDISKIDYSALDRPEVLAFLFHPRPEWGPGGSKGPAHDVLMPVEDDLMIGGRFHINQKTAPNILFFHGNGEIAADYDDLGPIYNGMGINFMVVDYRGYGRSTGRPTITAMMRDCHFIFSFVTNWLEEKGHSGPLIVMGRSLGSASALELAFHYRDQLDGLIVESGFAWSIALLRRLGMDPKDMGFEEKQGFENVDKVRFFDRPTLIIHAEQDHIIPFSDGQALYENSGSTEKTFLTIPGANHNDIFLQGFSEYMREVKTLAEKIERQRSLSAADISGT